MAKPIFIIIAPQDAEFIGNNFGKAMSDEYHVLCIKSNVSDFEFKLISDKQIEPVNLEELKRILTENV